MHRKHLQRYMPQLGELDAYKEVRGSRGGEGGGVQEVQTELHMSANPLPPARTLKQLDA